MAREREAIEVRELMRLFHTKPKFQLGRIVATSGAFACVSFCEMERALFRHERGEWGDYNFDVRASNKQSLAERGMIHSIYRNVVQRKFWIITEPDRTRTTILLPHEF